MMGNPYLMIKADLRKHWASSLAIFLLLSFALAVQFVALNAVRSIEDSLSGASSDYDLVVGAPGSKLDLTLASLFLWSTDGLPVLDHSYVERLSEDERTGAVAELVFADSYNGLAVVGVGEDFLSIRSSLELDEGEWLPGLFTAVAGSDVSLETGSSFHSAHTGSGHHDEEQAYLVTGRLKRTGTPWDQAVIVSSKSVWALHGLETGGVSAVLVKPADFPSAYSLRSEYMSGDTTAAFPGEVLSSLFGLFADFGKIANAVAVFIAALVFAAAILSLIASLSSKLRTIALLRSMGAGKAYVFVTIWLEAAVVFFLAGFGGYGLGALLSKALMEVAGSVFALDFTLSMQASDLLIVLIYQLVGFIAALVPAAMGYRVSPRAALTETR